MTIYAVLLRPEDPWPNGLPTENDADGDRLWVARCNVTSDVDFQQGTDGEWHLVVDNLLSDFPPIPKGTEVCLIVSHCNYRTGSLLVKGEIATTFGSLDLAPKPFIWIRVGHPRIRALHKRSANGLNQLNDLLLNREVPQARKLLESWFPRENAVGTGQGDGLVATPEPAGDGSDARDAGFSPTKIVWLFGGANNLESEAFQEAGGEFDSNYEDGNRSVVFVDGRARENAEWIKQHLSCDEAVPLPIVFHHALHDDEIEPVKAVPQAFDYSSGDRTYKAMLDELTKAARAENAGEAGAVVRCAWKWYGIYRRGVERDRITHLVHRCVGPWSSLCMTVEDLTGRAAEGDRRAVDALLSEVREEWTRIPSAGPLGTLEETRRRVLGKEGKRTVSPSDMADRQRLFSVKGQTPWDDDIFNTGIYTTLQLLADERANRFGEEGRGTIDALGEIWSLLGLAVEIGPIAEGGLAVSWKKQPGSWIARYTALFQDLVDQAPELLRLIEAHAKELANGAPDLVAIEVNKKQSEQEASFETLRDWVDALVRAFEAASAQPGRDEGGA